MAAPRGKAWICGVATTVLLFLAPDVEASVEGCNRLASGLRHVGMTAGASVVGIPAFASERGQMEVAFGVGTDSSPAADNWPRFAVSGSGLIGADYDSWGYEVGWNSNDLSGCTTGFHQAGIAPWFLVAEGPKAALRAVGGPQFALIDQLQGGVGLRLGVAYHLRPVTPLLLTTRLFYLPTYHGQRRGALRTNHALRARFRMAIPADDGWQFTAGIEGGTNYNGLYRPGDDRRWTIRPFAALQIGIRGHWRPGLRRHE